MNSIRFLLVLIFSLMMVSTISAQKRRKKKSTLESRNGVLMNLENFDRKIVHFGFALGFNSADFAVDYDLTKGDSLYKVESKKQSGFNLGIITDLHLGPYFDLRFIPTLMFSERKLAYTHLLKTREFETLDKTVESTFLMFPLELKYRSFRKDNYAMYLVGGGSFVYDLASQAETDNTGVVPEDIVIKLKKKSYQWQIGAGMDFFLQYFKFSTEIKMVYGIDNLLIQDHTIYSEPLNSLKTKMLVISFNFEG